MYGDERGSQDTLQINHGQLIDGIDIVKTSKATAKTKGSLEAYIYTRKPLIKVTNSITTISPDLYLYFFFRSMLRSNSRSHQSIV